MARPKKAEPLITPIHHALQPPEKMEVAPEQAKAWLEQNPGNRRIRWSHVKLLARLMTSGQWRLTHQGIAFDQEGRILDGQHRLLAIVECGQPVEIFVTFGLPREDMGAIDSGIQRSAADTGSILRGYSNSNERYAIANMFLTMETPDGTNKKFSFEEQTAVVEAEKGGMDFCLPHHQVLRPYGSYGSAFVYAYAVLPEAVELFVGELVTMAGLKESSPVIALARVHEKPRGCSTRRRMDLFCKACNAIKSYAEDKPVHHLQGSTIGFEHFRRLRAERGK